MEEIITTVLNLIITINKMNIGTHIYLQGQFLIKAMEKSIELIPKMYEANKKIAKMKKALEAMNDTDYNDFHTEQGF